MKTTTKLLAAAILLTGTSLASANPISIYTHTINTPTDGTFDGVNPAGGEVTRIRTVYNETEQTFAYSYDVSKSPSNRQNDAFWLVVSDGPDPKYDTDEYAILFGDLDTQRLTAYVYSGANSSDSWHSPGILLESYDVGTIDIAPGAPGTGSKTVSFEIDVAGINSYSADPEWDGITFGESVGIWFHPTAKTNIKYDANGAITKFKTNRAGYYDGKDIEVRQVPEPTALSLAGLGLLVFGFSNKLAARRRDSASA